MLNLDCANDISEKEEDEEMLKCAKHGYIRECPCKCEDFKCVRIVRKCVRECENE